MNWQELVREIMSRPHIGSRRQVVQALEDGAFLSTLDVTQETVEEAHDILTKQRLYVIEGAEGFWRPDAMGYTRHQTQAGLYPAGELHKYALNQCTLLEVD